jgi:hypothetical protein
MGDCTHGQEYTLTITPDKLEKLAGGYITVGDNTVTYNGVSVLPSVLSVQSVSSTSMRVIFSKSMSINDDLKSPSKYTFTDNLKTLTVKVESHSSVLLTTTPQIAGHIYDLTVG